ncbi:MAG: nitroreductase [Clostridia bacterium]|nr:nitroreductase [Clostridia bacterium]
MNDFLTVLLSRRSIRAYADRPVPRDLLDEVLHAGQHAPSGGNSQFCRFTVILSREVLDRLNRTARTSFAAMEVTPGMYPSKASAIRRSKVGPTDFFYGAPVLVLVSNRQSHPNAMADSACAIENMMLAATALGLGSCWINQIHWLTDDPAMRACLTELGIEEGETVCGSVALGYAAQQPAVPLARTGNRIDWVE